MTRCELCKKETDILLTIEYKNKEYQVCRECLEKSIYKKRKKELKNWIRSKRGGNMRITKILTIIGVLMILAGMTLQAIEYQDTISDQQKEINKLEKQIEAVATENNRLKAENEALWNNYYMNVTNQEGYEYYE